MVEGKPRVTVSWAEVRVAGVSGEEKDQSIWGGESLSRDEAAGEVREGGPRGPQEDLGFILSVMGAIVGIVPEA